jgi:glucosylceramidase
MEGGGAAFTDSAAWLINQKVSAARRDKVMQRLFDPGSGIGLSFLRNPIGSSDLTREWYSMTMTRMIAPMPASRTSASITILPT